jgi:hypothetical protein
MRRVKEVLRLRFELGLGQRQIARCCGMGLGTVHDYLERALAAGIGWPLPEGLGEEELEAKLSGVSAAPFVGHKLVTSGDFERNRDFSSTARPASSAPRRLRRYHGGQRSFFLSAGHLF